MLTKILLTLIAWGAGQTMAQRVAVCDANDSTIKFRMDAGYPGDVTRTHPVSIMSYQVGAGGVGGSASLFGLPVIFDGLGGVRDFDVADTALDTVAGFTVRQFPIAQRTGGDSASIGTSTPPGANGIIPVLRSGYIMARLNDVSAAPKLGDAVFVWCAADSGIHKQGGLEILASGGNTAALDPKKYQFQGPGDAKGNVEISVNV